MKLLEWEIYLTNLSGKQADAGTIIETYRLRWRIENLFKALKSNTHGLLLAKHRSNPSHVQVLVLAWLCLVVMSARTGYFAVSGTNPRPRKVFESKDSGDTAPPARYEHEVSILKSIRRIYKLMAHSLFMAAVGNTAGAFKRIEQQIKYHDRYEKRQKRKNLA